MLSIDEAIENLKYDIEIDMYIRDIAPQLAEWLEELKDYQDKNKMVVRVDVENMDNIKDKIDELSKYAESQYNKAIDDAMVASAKSICIGCGYLDGIKCKYKGGNCGVSKPMLETVIKALKQLKAGGENVQKK